MIRLLIHSRDAKLQSLLASALFPDFTVATESEQEGLRRAATEGSADVLLLDMDSMDPPAGGHLAVYDEISDLPLPVVIMTNDMSRVRAMDFLEKGAYDCIRKPPSIIELRIIVRRAHEHASMKRELERTRLAECGPDCDQLIGSSAPAQAVYDMIRRVADVNAFVLVTGESGTGKELVARAIHNLGSRSKEPFVAVSCGAIPETLIESELFGHERGAFTGSAGSRVGYFEQAGRGTLFLDEIGELSQATQVKLLRVLQEREFSRLGGSRLIPLAARVVFATHRNLQAMADEGAFRRDLYFRVNVMRINVPPLRARPEDIPQLARYFLAKYARECQKPVWDIRPNAMELLTEYDWPGNIRQLENAIQGAVIRADGDSISRSDLPPDIQSLAGDMAAFHDASNPGAGDGSFEELVRQYKINLARKTVAECNGNRSMAARKLQVSRAYLHRLIRNEDDGPAHDGGDGAPPKAKATSAS